MEALTGEFEEEPRPVPTDTEVAGLIDDTDQLLEEMTGLGVEPIDDEINYPWIDGMTTIFDETGTRESEQGDTI